MVFVLRIRLPIIYGIQGSSSTASARLTTRSAGPNLDRLNHRLRRRMEIRVDGSLDQAMRVLKRKLAKEGVFKEMKKRAFYEKPSVRRKRKRSEAQRRRRKEQRRRRASAM
jgi:small subunit ribosomal protein S21